VKVACLGNAVRFPCFVAPLARIFQIPPDFVVKSQAIDIIVLLLSLIERETSSKPRIDQGNWALPQTTENRKVEARKPLIFRDPIFRSYCQNPTLRQSPPGRLACSGAGQKCRVRSVQSHQKRSITCVALPKKSCILPTRALLSLHMRSSELCL
jgi:hypothetical protein